MPPLHDPEVIVRDDFPQQKSSFVSAIFTRQRYFWWVWDDDLDMYQKPWCPVVHIKIAGEWTFIPPKYGIMDFDPSPF